MPRASLNNKLNVKKQGMKTEQDYGYREWEDWFKAVEDGHGGTDLNVLQLDDVSEHGHRAVRHERLHIFLRQRCATISTFFFLKCTTEREKQWHTFEGSADGGAILSQLRPERVHVRHDAVMHHRLRKSAGILPGKRKENS
jgi:hypothetical protein